MLLTRDLHYRFVNHWVIAIVGHLLAILFVFVVPSIRFKPSYELTPEEKDPKMLQHILTYADVLPAIMMGFWLLCGLSVVQLQTLKLNAIWPNKLLHWVLSFKVHPP
jgi:hypothetical protein